MLPINAFSVENFKSFGPKQRIPLSRVNFFFGPNSHGKSAALKALGYLINGLLKKKIDLNSISLLDSSSDIYLNKNLLNWHTNNESFIIEYESHISGAGTFFKKLPIKVRLVIEEHVKRILKQFSVFEVLNNQEHSFFEINSEKITIRSESLFYRHLEEFRSININNIDPNEEYIVLKDGEDIGITLQSFSTVPEIKRTFNEFHTDDYAKRKIISKDINEIINTIFLDFDLSWKTVGYERNPADVGLDWIGPNRIVPNQTYSIDGEKVYFNNQMLNKTSFKQLNEWLKKSEYLDLEYEFIVIEKKSAMGSIQIKEFGVNKIGEDRFIPFTEIGSGISHILQILLPFFNEVEILVIQQPEIHLHPSLQVQLAKALIHLAFEKNVQLIIETHSEHFIKAAQLEVAKSLNYMNPIITKDDLSVLYVAKDEDGFSKVKQIELDETGAFTEPWPDDFFELSADLSLERLRNSIKSRN